MSRVILIAAIVVMLLAVGVVTAIVVHKAASQKEAAASATLAGDADLADEEAFTASSAEAVAARSVGVRPSVAAKVGELPPASAQPGSAATAQQAAGNSPDDLQARVRAMMRKMTPAERREMARQMAAMDQRRADFQAKFTLPSQQKLQDALGAIQMSDAQRQQLNTATRSMRPQMMQALSTYYDRQNQLSSQLQALNDAGLGSQAGPLNQAMNEVQSQINTVRDSFDQQYRQVISGILTPDQIQAAGLGPPPAPKRSRSR